MATQNEAKLKNLLAAHLPGTICVASWLEQHGVSRNLQKYYRRSGWLETAGTGAFKRSGENVGWQGGLYALQTQSRLPIHAGALTALALQGYSHYVRLGPETVFLFSLPRVAMPAWFRNHDWGQPVQHRKTSFLPENLALTDYQTPTFSIRISSPERAILECLHLSPDTVDLMECYQIMAGMTTLRPKLLQPILEQCKSIKVKRLFLYMANRAGHDWQKRLDLSLLELGRGARSITKGGVYIAQFGITIPEELARA
jgi:hypothetical protein